MGRVADTLPQGRSVVVGPGQPAPPAWAGRERLRVAKVDSRTADALSAAWRARRSVVLELEPGLGLDRPDEPPSESITGAQPWEWGPDLDLVGERLHHAVWANSADARGGTPRYRWAEMAVALGARLDPSGWADVVLPDGRPAICDGGPLDASLAARSGLAVVHRVALEHGSLEPLGDPAPQGVPLAPDQLAAVGEPLAGARVIAPAGSGKTRVLTERARLLQAGWRVPPGAMALVAYNVRAAEEMRSRLVDLPSLRIRTLNALSLRLCGRRRTIEEPEARRAIAGLVALPRRSETDPAAPWLEALSRVRLGLEHPEEVEEEIGDVSDLERVARAYRERLREDGAADFDEQVTAAIERLLADPAFRRRSQRAARVLLVDELQDLTPAHLLLVRLLSGPAGAVFGVGDDDQTVYGYAGATPRWLVEFHRWFPGSADHPLEVNYRCPAPVVVAASSLLSHNSVRVAKTVRAAKAGGESALTVRAGGDRPATTTAGRVAELLGCGCLPADIAVLARVNSSLVPVQVLLRHAGVPVNRPTDDRFLRRGAVRAALAWLSVALAPAGALPAGSLQEAARRPRRGMSRSLLELLARDRSIAGLSELAGWLERKGSGREAGKLRELVADVLAVREAAGRRGASTSSLLHLVRSKVGDGGLDSSAEALDQWSHGSISAHTDDLAALSELAELEPDPSRFAGWLGEHLSAPRDLSGVTLASVHSVKGREWPHVVVHHVTSGLLPHRLALDVEEERRVFHVALTRCIEDVTVVTGDPVSPFVAEMAAEALPAGGRPGRPSAAGRGPALRGAARRGGEPPTGRSRPGAEASRAARPVPGAETHPASKEAAERLRAWRSERARSSGRPAYTVFDDKTLAALAAAMPTSEAGLAAVPGIGPVKLEAYGPELMAMFEELRSAWSPGGEEAATRGSRQGG